MASTYRARDANCCVQFRPTPWPSFCCQTAVVHQATVYLQASLPVLTTNSVTVCMMRSLSCEFSNVVGVHIVEPVLQWSNSAYALMQWEIPWPLATMACWFGEGLLVTKNLQILLQHYTCAAKLVIFSGGLINIPTCLEFSNGWRITSCYVEGALRWSLEPRASLQFCVSQHTWQGILVISAQDFHMIWMANCILNIHKPLILPLTLIQCYEWDMKLHLHWKYLGLSEFCDPRAGSITGLCIIVVLLHEFLHFKCYMVDQIPDAMIPARLIGELKCETNLLLSNYLVLLQPWSVLMDSQFPMSTRHAVLVPLNISVLLVFWELLQRPFGDSWCKMPGSILLLSISFPLTKVQVIDWHPLLVVESMLRLQVHLLVAVSYVVIQMTNVTSTKYLESSWDPS